MNYAQFAASVTLDSTEQIEWSKNVYN